MKIGIIVHSQTGNTLSVAESLKEKLSVAGHYVTIEKVIAVNDEQADVRKIQLESRPDISGYEGIIFGASVRAFSLTAVMSAFLSQISSLKGKKVACYLTQGFPFAWMGGKRSIAQMTRLCESKEANISGTEIINWSHKQRKNRIVSMTENINKLF